MPEQIQEILFDPTIGKLVSAVIGVLIVITIVRIAQRSIGRVVKENSSRYKVRKFISFIGYVLVIFVIATVYSDKLGGLTVALGVAGAGIAFALQEVIASVAGWFAINFTNFYKTGDRVQLGGIKGDVIDIGILRSTIMEIGEWVKGDLYSGRVVRVANSFVFKEPVVNYSGDFPFLWDEITVPVRHSSDAGLARKILEDVAEEVVGEYSTIAQKSWKDMVKKFLIEDARVKPMVTMVFDENWITFTLRYVVDFKKRRGTKDLLFRRVFEEIAKTNGKVGIASAAQEITIMK